VSRRRHQDTRKERVTLAGEAAAEAALVGAAVAEVEAALAITPDLTAAAFFDVDNTMLMGASIFYFARGLAARNFLTTGALAQFAWQQLKFRLIGKELSAEEIRIGREQALLFVAGRPTKQLVELGEDIYDELMADRIWSGTLALAKMHLDAGQRVWLVTATPVELATIIAHRLGLTGALGTVAETTADGVYTGRLVGDILHGSAKAQAVRALAVKEGLDLRLCTAYSDSANDIPMLSLVGQPCAINPDAALRSHAKLNGWRIRDYRTGRKAAKVGVPAAAGVGAAVGGVFAGLALRRRRQRRTALRRLVRRLTR
jgi:HAD superfamily hydrolase (TIGR01490 family)